MSVSALTGMLVGSKPLTGLLGNYKRDFLADLAVKVAIEIDSRDCPAEMKVAVCSMFVGTQCDFFEKHTDKSIKTSVDYCVEKILHDDFGAWMDSVTASESYTAWASTADQNVVDAAMLQEQVAALKKQLEDTTIESEKVVTDLVAKLQAVTEERDKLAATKKPGRPKKNADAPADGNASDEQAAADETSGETEGQ